MRAPGLTKKARKERARTLIDSNRIDVPFSEQDTVLMNGLLGVQLDGYVRRWNPRYPSDPRHLHALDADGWGSFSWTKAISPINDTQAVKRVMRSCVQELMNEYRETREPVCVHCGAGAEAVLSVDHTPPFDTIADEFIGLHGVPLIKDSPDGVGNMFYDIDVEAAWIEFHQARVVYLQILCRPCNSSKGKRAAPGNKK